MVAQVSPQIQEKFEQTVDIYSLLGEPSEVGSAWNELKIARLQGFDYIYFSSNINKKLACKTALQAFLSDLFLMADTHEERAKIFIYMEKADGSRDYFEFLINWTGKKIKDFHINSIDNPKNREFIRTLFDYSSGIYETIGSS